MGTGRWDDDSRREQGRSPRSRRPDDDARQNRMSSRGGSRDNFRDDGTGRRERPPRGGSRYPRRDVEDDWDDAGRGGSSAGSSGGRGRSAGSARDERGGPPDRSGDRSMRGGRPSARDEWDAPTRGRGGGPGYSGASRRPPQGQGSGLWGDEEYGPRGRPGMAGPAGMRDPRAPRTGRGAAPEPQKGRLSFLKGLGIIVGMFVLGIAVAFGYFTLTRPNPQADNPAPGPTNTAAPQTTPTTAPKVTPSPSSRIPGAGVAYVFVYVGDERASL